MLPERSLRLAAAALAATALAALPSDAVAQSPPAGLRQRMDAFAAALRDEAPVATIAGFFPRDAAWEMVRVPERPTHQPAVQTLRVAPDSTLAAVTRDRRTCDSFTGVVGGEAGPVETTLRMQTLAHRRPWRYAGRYRFVPPGEGAASPTWVEWRRERGTWVISRVGEQYYYSPRVIGVDVHDRATRDTTAGNDLPLERRLAANQQWYRDNEPVVIAGHRYTKYGLPRPIDDGLLRRYGSVGTVPVFVERALDGGAEVMYVLVAPGEYQPYQGIAYGGCRAR